MLKVMEPLKKSKFVFYSDEQLKAKQLAGKNVNTIEPLRDFYQNVVNQTWIIGSMRA